MAHTVHNHIAGSRIEDTYIQCPVCGHSAYYMLDTDTFECVDCDYVSVCIHDNPGAFEYEEMI